MAMIFKHLADRQVDYTTHFRFALGAGIVLIKAGIASVVHAFVPALFTGYSESKTLALARLARQRKLHNGKK